MSDVKMYKVQLRDATSQDLELIFNSHLISYWSNSWLTGFHNSHQDSFLNQVMSKQLYMKKQHRRLELMIANSATRIIVACDQENTNTVLGWLIVEPLKDGDQVYPVVHYIYVKHIAKNIGIMDMLLNSLEYYSTDKPLFFSHATKAALKIASKRRNWIFDETLKEKYNPNEEQ